MCQCGQGGGRVSRRCAISHPWKATEKTEGPFVHGEATLASSNGPEAAWDFSLLARTQSGCPVSPPMSSCWEVQGTRGHQRPPGCHCGPLFFVKSQEQVPAFSLQESPPRWLPPFSSISSIGRRGGQRWGARGEQRFSIPALLPFQTCN